MTETIRDQFEAGYLDIPAMGRYSLAEIDSWPTEVRRIAADSLRAVNAAGALRQCEVGAGNGTDAECGGPLIPDRQPEGVTLDVCAKHLIENRNYWMGR